jgi:hypothetical protein
MGHEMDRDELDDAMRAMDTDRSGVVNQTEFTLWWQRYHSERFGRELSAVATASTVVDVAVSDIDIQLSSRLIDTIRRVAHLANPSLPHVALRSSGALLI